MTASDDKPPFSEVIFKNRSKFQELLHQILNLSSL